MSKEGKGQSAHKHVEKAHGLANKFDNSDNGKHGKPHSPSKTSHGLSGYHEGAGNVGPAGGHLDGEHHHHKQAGGKKRHTPGGYGGHHKHNHPMAHHEVHHASHHDHTGHKGHHGEHNMLHSGKISKRPMGGFRYHEVFDKD